VDNGWNLGTLRLIVHHDDAATRMGLRPPSVSEELDKAWDEAIWPKADRSQHEKMIGKRFFHPLATTP